MDPRHNKSNNQKSNNTQWNKIRYVGFGITRIKHEERKPKQQIRCDKNQIHGLVFLLEKFNLTSL